jgi:microcystin-dependent protein
VVAFAGAVAPAGFLFCDGTVYLNVTYPTLAALLGTTYGGVLGVSFGVPDTRGRVLVGAGAGPGLTPRALAATGGEENHVLSTAELAAHDHAPLVVTDPGHVHDALVDAGAGGGFSLTRALGVATVFIGGLIRTVTTGVTVAPTSVGSNNGHNTMQPFLAQNAIIKT